MKTTLEQPCIEIFRSSEIAEGAKLFKTNSGNYVILDDSDRPKWYHRILSVIGWQPAIDRISAYQQRLFQSDVDLKFNPLQILTGLRLSLLNKHAFSAFVIDHLDDISVNVAPLADKVRSTLECDSLFKTKAEAAQLKAQSKAQVKEKLKSAFGRTPGEFVIKVANQLIENKAAEGNISDDIIYEICDDLSELEKIASTARPGEEDEFDGSVRNLPSFKSHEEGGSSLPGESGKLRNKFVTAAGRARNCNLMELDRACKEVMSVPSPVLKLGERDLVNEISQVLEKNRDSRFLKLRPGRSV